MPVSLGKPIYRYAPSHNVLVQVTNLNGDTYVTMRFTVYKLTGETNNVSPMSSGPLYSGQVNRVYESDWSNYPGWAPPFRLRATVAPTTQYSETTIYPV
ncbi:MAG: hypothetical protein ABW252_04180 [Polyangiales bacterium]